jgi:membrane protein implicated in regulation of membrane protease activity
MHSSFWLIILVIGLIIEAITLGLATIWFAFGALVAWILAMFNFHPAVQITVFFVVSLILLYYTRPVAVKYLKLGHTKTNYESIVQKTGIVTERIDNFASTGLVKVEGQIWTARSSNNEIIEKDSIVLIEEVKGVKLFVIKKMEG